MSEPAQRSWGAPGKEWCHLPELRGGEDTLIQKGLTKLLAPVRDQGPPGVWFRSLS